MPKKYPRSAEAIEKPNAEPTLWVNPLCGSILARTKSIANVKHAKKIIVIAWIESEIAMATIMIINNSAVTRNAVVPSRSKSGKIEAK